MDTLQMIRPHIKQMPAYPPVLPLEVRSQQLGLDPEQIIKLDANENPYGPAPAVIQALAQYPYPHIYPDPECRQLRRVLADYHRVPFEDLLVGLGADELIDLIMRLFLDPGDRILNCSPTFGMYAFDAHLNAARVIDVRRRPDFSLDLDAIKTAVETYRPKLVFIASPNNPDGRLLPDTTLEQLLALPLVVALDEAYVEFAPAGSSRIQLAAERQNLIVLRTFSKWAGLAGLRVGYGVFPSSLMPYLWKIKQPYNMPGASTMAALASLEQAHELQRRGRLIVAERERLFAKLQTISWLKPYPSHANFILCRVLGRDAATLKEELAQKGILIRHFDKPGLTDHIRISVGKPEHTDALMKELMS